MSEQQNFTTPERSSALNDFRNCNQVYSSTASPRMPLKHLLCSENTGSTEAGTPNSHTSYLVKYGNPGFTSLLDSRRSIHRVICCDAFTLGIQPGRETSRLAPNTARARPARPAHPCTRLAEETSTAGRRAAPSILLLPSQRRRILTDLAIPMTNSTNQHFQRASYCHTYPMLANKNLSLRPITYET